VGNFCPIKPGCGGADLVKEMKDKDGNVKYDSVTGAKGYRWLESEMVRTLGKEADIDRSYYDRLVDDAVEAISKYGDFEWFISDNETILTKSLDTPPWKVACGEDTCEGCPHFSMDDHHMHCSKGYDIGDMIAMNRIELWNENDDFKKR
jgi:hypothetical protein